MPPENDISGNVIVYLVVDDEKKEINPVPVWYGSKSITTIKRNLPKLQPIEAVVKILWKRFQNNKKARLRKQQIMKSIPKKTDARCFLKWLEAKGAYGQMPFSWMAYWYRRLEHDVN